VLNSVATNNLDAIAKIFAQGATSDDPLMHVIGGNEKTQAGTYAVEITTMAERAKVSGDVFVNTSTEYLAAGGKVLNPVDALTIDSGATFELALNGGVASTVNFTAGSYASKDAVAVQMQADILAQLGSTVSVAYDTSQARFEFTNTAGLVDISAATSMNNQGFSNVNYSGEQLIDLTGSGDATFDVSINGSVTASAAISEGKYTLSELAEKMRTSINNMSEVSESGAKVSVSTDGGILNITSERYGFASNVSLSNFVNLGNAGLTTDLMDDGVNVEGTISTSNGLLNLGAYANSEDGRKIKISDYAVLGSEPADVRGLEFEILGGTVGSRGDIVFSQGFASRLDETIKNLLSADSGLVSNRIDSLTSKNEDYEEKRETLDIRYERLLLKYQMQFSSLQSLLSSTQQTSDFLTATFSNNNNNN
ncbi:MAG: flagellar filament capping protein FliD, partial [Pseudomonadota bacterium]|nr:flagellar filament capping protein FliD [Pseudomonadota bacterium]